MIDFKNTMSTPLTRQEKKNVADMAVIRKHKSLMAKANEAKELYLELKSKNTSGLSLENLEALKRLTKTSYDDALNYYNKAQQLKTNNPNTI